MGCLEIIALLINKVLIALKENISMTYIEIKKSDLLVDSDIATEELKKMGFVNLGGARILPDSEVKQLQALSSNLLIQFEQDKQGADKLRAYSNTAVGVGASNIEGLPQYDPLISHSINKILSDKSVKAVLNSILGADYKIWQIGFRRSSPDDKGLGLHQDSFGETGLVILLDDNLAGDGATFFLPGSHLLSKTASMLGIGVPPVLADLMRGLLKPFVGRAGDIGFFFNRTWHGRFSNSSLRNHDAILISFFPSGATFGFGGSYLEWSKEYLSEIKGTELGRLLDPSSGTELIGDKRYKVANQSGNTQIPFALQIADPVDHGLKPAGWKIHMVIFLLRAIIPLSRIVRRSFLSFRRDLK